MDEVFNLGKTRVNSQTDSLTEEVPISIDLRIVFYLFVASLSAEMFKLFDFASIPKLLGFTLLIIVTVRGKLLLRMPTAPFYFFLWYYSFILLSVRWLNPFFFSYWKMKIFQIGQLLILMWITSYLVNYKKILIGALQSYSYCLIVLTILSHLGISGFVSEQAEEMYGERATVGIVDPNRMCFMLGIPFIYFMHQMLTYYKEKNKIRYRFFIVLGYLIFEIIRTGSRGGQIAILSGIIALLFTKDYSLKKYSSFFIIVLTIVVFVTASFSNPKMKERWELSIKEGNMASREKIFPESIKMVKRKPLLGYGLGEHLYILGPAVGRIKRSPHNSFLWVLHEVGFLGGSPYIIGFILCGIMAFRKRKGYLENLPFALWVLALMANSDCAAYDSKTTWFILAIASSSERIRTIKLPYRK